MNTGGNKMHRNNFVKYVGEEEVFFEGKEQESLDTVYISILELYKLPYERMSVNEIENDCLEYNKTYESAWLGVRPVHIGIDIGVWCKVDMRVIGEATVLGGLDSFSRDIFFVYGQPMKVTENYIFLLDNNPINATTAYQEIGISGPAVYGEKKYSLSETEDIQEKLQILYRNALFQGTQNYISENTELCEKTQELMRNTKIYQEHFYSSKVPDYNMYIGIENAPTLEVAETYAKRQKTAVLNFANPLEPGGGVFRGADAQEEYLCRMSNLYHSLSSESAHLYYAQNRVIKRKNQFNSMFLGTDAIVYSPEVTVFKKTESFFNGEKIESITKDWFNIDVITCAAPFFSGLGYILPNGDLQYLFENRIRNILETAIENDVKTIILGAFGCGFFHNPPEVVADAFRTVLLEERYRKAFFNVIFAIKPKNKNDQNIEIFKQKLGNGLL